MVLDSEASSTLHRDAEDVNRRVDVSECDCACASPDDLWAKPIATNGDTFQPISAVATNLIAAGLSTLCVIHCVALPVLVALMPMVAQVAENEIVHRLLVLAAIPLSLRVVWLSRFMYSASFFISVVLLGLTSLAAGAFVEDFEAYEQPLTLLGGMLLAAAHIWHWLRRCRTGGGVQRYVTEPQES
ncbi:MAG: MerC domain-containing protein [Gammaproteobacteria bacterium]|nr:MerC domain-containing protein [Gammaproteobacteria bacterium]